ncbi:MAG: malonyl-ACP O-methyltransferase BioC [Steroidobacteraceae bacterium]|nr:malonyl-ACP O-methyltransferase BioC [Steroidobacteraceae bacterium]MDW8260832.1 malonyl-ACP O-methyltransferase BioC [Gammaproteobacteria bacterium]
MSDRGARADVTPDRLDRRAVRRHFAAASASYDGAAQLQSTVRAELLARAAQLFHPTTATPCIVDLGAGTGAALPELANGWPSATLIAVDFAEPMLRRARAIYAARAGWLGWWDRQRGRCRFAALCGDVHALPLADASVDFVFCNLLLQWASDLDRALLEIRRVLRPNGLLLLSSFGPDTLRELRAAWQAADTRPHVSTFVDMHDLGDALGRAGFVEPVLDVDRLQTHFDNVHALLRQLQALGARNATLGRASGLTGRQRFATMLAAYERYRDATGRLPASWEVIYASAFAGDAPRTGGRSHGEFTIAAAELAERLRRTRS